MTPILRNSEVGSSPHTDVTRIDVVVTNGSDSMLDRPYRTLLSIEKYMSYRGVGGCVSMMFSICQAMKNRIRGRVTDRIE